MPTSNSYPLFPRLASLISGFLKATQLFSPDPLSSLHVLHVQMFPRPILNAALSLTKRLSDCRSASLRLFSNHISSSKMMRAVLPAQNHTLDSSSPSFSILLWCFLCWMQPVIWPLSNTFSMTSGCVFQCACWRNEKLLIASASWKIVARALILQ